MPKISVIIVNWNGKHFLDSCLSSLRSQTFRDFETILVDNGSQDGSVEFVWQEFPEVHLVALDHNSGFSSGNIAGYDLALGNLIVLLNNDTKTHPEFLQQINHASEEFPEAGSFACKMLYFDEPGKIENCGFDLSMAGATLEVGRDKPDGLEWAHPRKVFGACGGAAAYRRRTLEEIGFLDPKFFLIYEDVDLAFRAQLRGRSCIHLPGAIVYHRYRASIGQRSATQVFYSQRNIELVYLRNMPLGLVLRSLPYRVLYELGAAIYFVKLGSGPIFFRAKMEALRLAPQMWRERRRILGTRTVSTAHLRGLMKQTSLLPKFRKLFSLWSTSPPTVSHS
jgi:GT2 family glycosyltransferase